MGLNVHRLGDICTGHGCYGSRPSAEGSPNVFVNSIPVHRQGDAWESHCCPGSGCHGSELAAGSSTVYANSLQMARIEDPVACGSTCSIAQCSPNVFAGG
mgnify:CR=1 FL=1